MTPRKMEIRSEILSLLHSDLSGRIVELANDKGLSPLLSSYAKEKYGVSDISDLSTEQIKDLLDLLDKLAVLAKASKQDPA